MSIPLDGLSNKLARLLRDLSFQNDASANNTAQIVTLRGCRLNDDSTISQYGDPLIYTDRYDDLMIVFGKKADGQPYLVTFRATAKPGLAWIHSKSYQSSDQGCPTVQPGQYPYVRGLHKGHQAMRQQANYPVCVIRDLNDNAKLEDTDRVDYPIWTGINIHAGGASPVVGYNSSGCQVIWGGWQAKPWKTFYNLIYGVAKTQNVFHYTLLDFALFAEWHDHGPAEWILFGSTGPAVARLQNNLVSDGYFGLKSVDGIWGRSTDEAVRRWQKAQGMAPTGIVRL